LIGEIKQQVRQALIELDEQAGLQPGDLLVIGCSTSEIQGKRIGTGSSAEVAEALVAQILTFCSPRGVIPAFQSCEHLNRALVLERSAARAYDLDEVTVMPHPGAGGAMSSQAMKALDDPVVVEHLSNRGKAGIDIGNTLIGMHLRPVVVPVRISTTSIGMAPVVCARTRPKLIGGKRALYPDN
jgi:uncharacterized protein (TIGR01440 family)